MGKLLQGLAFCADGTVRSRYSGAVLRQKGEELFNSIEMRDKFQDELNNDYGGYQIPIDTLTQIAREISMQKFYDIKVSDFLPVVVGQGAFSQSLLTYKVGSSGNQFKQNIFRSGQNSALPQANTQIQGSVLEIFNYAEGLTYNLFEMEQASRYGNFDLIEAKERARKQTYDQGFIQTAFYGIPEFGAGFYGLLNQPLGSMFDSVAPDTTTLPTSISKMTATQINTLVGTWIYKYYSNTGFTTFPKKLIMPQSDFQGLFEYINPDFPLDKSTRFDVLMNAFKGQTGNANFKIIPTIYCSASQSFGTHTADVYVLLNDEVKSLKMLLPVPYTTTLPGSVDGFSWQNAAYGQMSGVQLVMPKETQYFYPTDGTAT